jgi:hypothetical protein
LINKLYEALIHPDKNKRHFKMNIIELLNNEEKAKELANILKPRWFKKLTKSKTHKELGHLISLEKIMIKAEYYYENQCLKYLITSHLGEELDKALKLNAQIDPRALRILIKLTEGYDEF